MNKLHFPRLAVTLISAVAAFGSAFALAAPAHAATIGYLQLDPGLSPGHLDDTGDTLQIALTPNGSTSTIAPSIDDDLDGADNDVDARWQTGSQSGSSFSYGYTFTISSGQTGLTGTGISTNIDGLTMTLFKDRAAPGNSYTPGTTPITAGATAYAEIVPGFGTFGYALQTPGIYTLVISGALAPNAAYGSFLGSIQPVPLPGSVGMFGAALAGLVAFGTRRRALPLSC